MFAVTVIFDIKTGRMEDFLPLMLANARASRKSEPGCQQFDVCRKGDRIFLYEIYDDQAAFDAHLATDHFLSFDAAVTDMVVEKRLETYASVMR
ncbi:MAG: putative quinol monooxygenase [Pseudomonadota bacterium]